MKTDTLFYRLFLRKPKLALELLGLDYAGDSYCFSSEEIKQTAFRIDGLFKPVTDDPEQPLIFVEVQYQPDKDFYGRLFSEITLYLYQNKPNRDWLVLVIYPHRGIEKSTSVEFLSFLNSPQLHRIYLEDYQNRTDLSPTLEFIRLIASDKQQTITRAKELADRLDKIDLDGLDFIETILVYKLPHLSREEIKKMLSLYEVELKQTRFYQEIAEEERKEGRQEGRQAECVNLLSRQLRRKFGVQPQLENNLQTLTDLPLEKLEDLADTLLDFNAMTDLETWLADHT
jgi:predicted transposase/invertase (TIGR01784 family)